MIYAWEGITPVIDADSWVAPGAHVMGRVVLCAGASVWFGATLRGDNEEIRIGEGSNVQEGCIFHTDMGYPLSVGRDCTIGHNAILHGCTIGNTCLVGMGSIIMDDVVMQDRTMLGAGSLVSPGKTLESGYLYIGRPAVRVRLLTPEELAFLTYSAEHYVRVKNNYLAQQSA